MPLPPQDPNHARHLSPNLHVAPTEPHPIKRSLWQRWMSWSGSFLVMSILVHVLLIGGATVLVVQVVQGRKEKLKFTAPPPSTSASEHRVKPSKKKTAVVPAISKHITSTAANASVTLPAMEMNATGSDVMASVMSSMGASSLGAGGSAGMAAMPLTGMTVFGFKGTPKTKGLVGKFYDFKQFKDRKDNMTFALRDDIKCVIDFLSGSHDPNLFEKYFCPFTKLFTGRVYIPTIAVPIDALKAFDVEKEVKTPGQWIIHYSGTVVAPRSGEYRFRGAGDNLMAVSIRQGGENAPAKNVLLQSAGGYMGDVRWDPLLKGANSENKYGLAIGNWFTVKENEEIAIDVLIGEIAGTSFNAYLLIEEKGRTYMPKGAYPVFEVIKDLPPLKVEKDSLPVSSEQILFKVK